MRAGSVTDELGNIVVIGIAQLKALAQFYLGHADNSIFSAVTNA